MDIASSENLYAQISSSLLESVCTKIIRNDHEITDDDIALLDIVFEKRLEKAFRMIDNNCFELVNVANTKRNYIVVHGFTGIYTLYPNVNFCQCCAYKIQSTTKKETYICKHILGSRLALALNRYKQRITPEFIYHNMVENNELLKE